MTSDASNGWVAAHWTSSGEGAGPCRIDSAVELDLFGRDMAVGPVISRLNGDPQARREGPGAPGGTLTLSTRLYCELMTTNGSRETLKMNVRKN
jgi:hypothetical protein